jgi:hypothetical protein
MIHNHPSGYPTRAREDVDPREVVEVGTIETKTFDLSVSADANDLSWWIEDVDLIDLGVIRDVRQIER